MQVLYENGGRSRELDVQVNNPAATVADLASALESRPGPERGLWVGGRFVEPGIELRDAGLHEGVEVGFGAQRTGPWTPCEREVVVTNGLDAGRRASLGDGAAVVGRDETCDITLRSRSVSRHHAVLRTAADGQVTVTDQGSRNGTYVGWDSVEGETPVADGVPIEVGAMRLEVREVRDRDRPVAVDPLRHVTAAGTIPFNRPPRVFDLDEPDLIKLPRPPQPNSGNSAFSLITIVSPLVMAAGMYFMWGSTRYLLFAGLAPILALVRFVDGKRRGRKSERGEKKRWQRELRECAVKLREASEVERARRELAYPDPAEIMRRASLPSVTSWERRPDHDDFLLLRAGMGKVPWDPPVPERNRREPRREELVTLLAEGSVLYDAALPLDLSGGNVVGIVGDREAGLALARSLVCQAAELHGPADLPMMVLAHPEARRDWDWTKWLPHTRSEDGNSRRLSGASELSEDMAASRLASAQASNDGGGISFRPVGQKGPAGPALFVVTDDESLTEGRKAPVRNLLRGDAGTVAGVVLASTVDRLPALCTSVIEMDGPDGDAALDLPQEGKRVEHFVACGVAEDVARDFARALARFEDPELDIVGAGLPASIRLLPLLGMEHCTVAEVLTRWKAGGVDPRPEAPIGVSERGTFTMDFVADGPHGLVGGTTGAGKSELLRTMVAGMAATVDPDHLTFLLVDFKGGSAFDQCALLPHTVGMVTDLDEHLAQRALRCLEAELKYRERVLRDAGATDLPDYLRNGGDREPLPRLLVIIDEFATLKAELPNFIDALVGVAQRGRSLGVHMLLATQRPQGAISENIKANTNLRIALRMQDTGDSNDVIGVGDAAAIPRSAPGRAYVRLGPGEIVAIQSALSTGERNEEGMAPVEVASFVYGPVPRASRPSLPVPPQDIASEQAVEESSPETDLGELVAAIDQAFTSTGRPQPRRPWPEPLPEDLDLDELFEAAVAKTGVADGGSLDFVPVALADDPDAQSQYPVGWEPRQGNLTVHGMVGSGTTTVLSSLALSLARMHPPDRCHLFVMDFGAGELGPLEQLPHCGGVALSNERERQLRIIRHLRTELDRRKQLSLQERRECPMIVAMIDGWSTLASEFDDFSGMEVVDRLARVASDGPEVGMYLIVTNDRGGGIHRQVAGSAPQRWGLRLADRGDYSTVGVNARDIPGTMPPGRVLISGSNQLVHVGRPRDGLAEAAARHATAAGSADSRYAPERISSLPAQVRFAELGMVAEIGPRPWRIPVGLGEETLAGVSLVAYEGEHALIAGPARSGKSTTLLTIASAVLAAEPNAHIAAIAGKRSPLSKDPRIAQLFGRKDLEEVPSALSAPAPVVLLLIDDAETVNDDRLATTATSEQPNLLLVAAARSDMVRSGKRWTTALRRSQLGVLLQPEGGFGDDEVLGAKIPRRAPVAMVTGRGYVVNSGEPALAQMAVPD